MSQISRTFLSILGLAIIAGAALWIVGGKTQRYTTNLVIDAPPRIVFPYLADSELQMKWIDGLLDVMSETGSRNQIGSVAKITVREGDRQYRYEDTVLRYEEGQLLSVRSQNNVVAKTIIFRLEENQGKTNVVYNVRMSRLGAGRMLALFSKDDMQERIEKDIRSLKTLIEANYNSGALSSKE